MKRILLSLALIAGFATMNAQITVFEDGFEDYEDFTIDNFGGWIQIDLDGGTTWGVTELGDFPNAGYVGAGIIFNASALVPDPGAQYHSHSGDKGLYFFASGASGSAFPNDDWTISPLISLSNVTNSKLSLYAKSLTNSYGPDQFEIGISTTGTDEGDFDIISSMINPGTDYEFHEFDLTSYDGQDIYIAIHCTTDDGLLLMIDDFLVKGDETVGISDFNTASASIYPNPVSDTFNVDFSSKFNTNDVSVTITDMIGKTVMTFDAASSYNISSLSKGVYMVSITDGTNTATQKIIKK